VSVAPALVAMTLALASPFACGMPALDTGRQRLDSTPYRHERAEKARPGSGTKRTHRRRRARERARMEALR